MSGTNNVDREQSIECEPIDDNSSDAEEASGAETASSASSGAGKHAGRQAGGARTGTVERGVPRPDEVGPASAPPASSGVGKRSLQEASAATSPGYEEIGTAPAPVPPATGIVSIAATVGVGVALIAAVDVAGGERSAEGGENGEPHRDENEGGEIISNRRGPSSDAPPFVVGAGGGGSSVALATPVDAEREHFELTREIEERVLREREEEQRGRIPMAVQVEVHVVETATEATPGEADDERGGRKRRERWKCLVGALAIAAAAVALSVGIAVPLSRTNNSTATLAPAPTPGPAHPPSSDFLSPSPSGDPSSEPSGFPTVYWNREESSIPIDPRCYSCSVMLSRDGARCAINNQTFVRTFDLIEREWVQIGSDINSEEQGTAHQSISLCESGNVLAVGRTLYKSGNDTGYVQVFNFTNNNWRQVGSSLIGDSIGYSVSLSGSCQRIAVGAWRADAAKIYDLVDGDWIQVGSDLRGKNGSTSFGRSVELSASGFRVVVGDTSGYVRVFDLVSGNWRQIGHWSDRFGSSLSLSANGSRLAIGDSNFGLIANGAGRVQVFDLIGMNWVPVGDSINGELPGDRVGDFVALSSDGSRIAVGGGRNTRVFEVSENLFAQLGSGLGDSGSGLAFSPGGTRIAVAGLGVVHFFQATHLRAGIPT